MGKDPKSTAAEKPKKRVEKKPAFGTPVLTKYGTVKDVYRGPSCKAVMAAGADK